MNGHTGSYGRCKDCDTKWYYHKVRGDYRRPDGGANIKAALDQMKEQALRDAFLHKPRPRLPDPKPGSLWTLLVGGRLMPVRVLGDARGKPGAVVVASLLPMRHRRPGAPFVVGARSLKAAWRE